MHKKPLYAIMTNPLSKPTNKGEEEGEGGWTFFSEISEKERKNKERERAYLGITRELSIR